MIGLVLITHGTLSQVLVETVSMIMGPQPDLTAITFSARESIETLRQKAFDAIAPYRETGCLVMTDVLGGSATNICVEFLKTDGVRILTGVNLPMVMEAANHRNMTDLTAFAQRVRDGAARGIIDLKAFYEERAAKKKAPAA
ncbi:MAG TPA: hypothetical protein PKM25_12930 [Candidatus Ozemobacteraceae bacterium]|nr:hypothetical protein [Candidatus Ozemobacteraceae bacterium]